MSITDELREFARRWPCTDYIRKDMLAIADRIDAEHERKVQQAHADGLNEQMDFHDNFVPSNYILLPVDADGEPIHVGDVVTAKLMFGGTSKPLAVDRMELSRGKDGYLWTIALDTDKSCFNLPKILRHYHAPTVEDVLREFGKAWVEWEDGSPYDPIAKYAAKLRLAEGEDA